MNNLLFSFGRYCKYLFFLLMLVSFSCFSEPVQEKSPASTDGVSPQKIDLSLMSSDDNLALDMLGFSVPGNDDANLNRRLGSGEWRRIDQHEDLLEAPRQRSTLWLKTEIFNSGSEPILRWIEFSPWRLNSVDAWFIDPDDFELKKYVEAGLDVPIEAREVAKNRTLVPVSLSPGETLVLVVRIYSDSRPFLTVNSWDPVEFSVEEVEEHQFHAILLSSILTLCLVLFLKLDFRYFLLGSWLIVTFVFESEKEGYISRVIFSGLFEYSANLRFSTWILTGALFLIASVYLLGLVQSRWWRCLTPAVLLVTAAFGTLSFVLDGAVIRNLGSTIDLVFSLIWLLMLPAALRIGHRWQYALLGVLSIWWLAANFVLIGYITNIYYTASFASVKIFAEMAVILGLLLIYSRQKHDHKNYLEQRLRSSEQEHRAQLERLVEKRTHELNVALDSAHKSNEAKVMLLGRISHDLKTPLTSLIGYSQLVGAEDGRLRDYARTVYNSAVYMSHLVNRLTSYARGGAEREVRSADFHIEEFFSSVRNEAEILAKKNHNRFSMCVSSSEFPVVRCDEVSLRQVVINLIDNAAKYTRSGIIALDVECSRLKDSQTLWLALTIKDTGCGISREYQARLFEPFFRASRSGEGVGLGLPIVKDLVAAMDGKIRLLSEEGVGTEIRIFVPVEKGEEAGLVDGESCALSYLLPAYRAVGLSAWVVEDSPPILELLCDDLNAMGFDVKGFQNGQDAISTLSCSDEAPDLVVTDYRLQDVSGDEVLEAARKKHVDVSVMLVSAIWSVLEDRRRDDLGYASFLPKPIELANFRREVARVCGLEVADPVDNKYIGTLDTGDVRTEVQRLEELLRLGAVSDILDWCDSFAAVYPDKAGLAVRLRSQAERGDFAAVEESIKLLA